MLKRILGFFSNDIAIDLGTANTLVYVRQKGIILNEPSVVAIKKAPDGHGRHVIAVGEEAKLMLGRVPDSIEVIRPMKGGVIADFDITVDMLKFFIRKVQDNQVFSSPRIIICIPCGSTQVERRAIRDSVLGVGAREVYLIEEPMAVAIGAHLPVNEPTGSMVIDIGGGTTEVAVLSLGGMIYSHSLRVAGDAFDEAIINHIRWQHSMLIGTATAEHIKISIATVWSKSKHLEMEIGGRDVSGGMSRRVMISSEELCKALDECMSQIVRTVCRAIENTPPELSADIGEKGIIVAGGGALLRDIDKRLSEDTGLPIVLIDDPLTCVAKGCGRALEEMDTIGDIFSN